MLKKIHVIFGLNQSAKKINFLIRLYGKKNLKYFGFFIESIGSQKL